MNKEEIKKEETEPDWKSVAMEIWNDFDNVALFLESHNSDRVVNPFLHKNLLTRFKYFRFYRNKIMTTKEYEKERKEDEDRMNLLYKTIKS